MIINVSGPLAEKLGEKELSLSLADAPLTVREVIDEMIQKHPEAQPYLRNEAGQMPNGIMLVINQEIMPKDQQQTINSNDQLSFIPAISGG